MRSHMIKGAIVVAWLFGCISQCFGWAFDTQKDAMGRGEVKIATASSENAIKFKFPYAGDQYATLMLRVHPKHGRDVILSIDKGQFLCRIGGCSVTVRFDEGKPQTLPAAGPSDHDSTILFIRGFDTMVNGIRKAKKLRIEALFFQEGTRVFEFDVADFGTWPNTPAPKK